VLLVLCPTNGRFAPEYIVNAAEIVELVEAVNENAVPPPVVQAHPSQGPPSPPQKPKTFEDPAILSMGKRPTPVSRPSVPAQWNATSMERKDSARTATGREERVLRDITPAATLAEPFNFVSMERIDSSMTARGRKESSKESISATLVEPVQKIHIVDVDTDGIAEGLILDDQAEVSPAQPVPKAGRKPRRRKGRRNEEFIEPDVAPGKETQRSKRWREGRRTEEFLESDVVPAKETQRSKGWRQTPLLEPNPSFQPFTTLKKSKRNGRTDENGWATEDATDVQDMGDFDFAGSLAKFDKKTVFTQIQAEDGIADEDRLVAHNRLPRAKPGTAGGKNLHYTENVLDLPNGSVKVKADVWKSEAGESDLEERPAQRDSGSGRHSRRAESRVPTTRRPPSRKGSSITNVQPARTLSVSRI
jgi:enhancer of mRNA-decapping protein 3